MIFRLPNGSLMEINKYDFLNDKLYYEKIKEIQNTYIKKPITNYTGETVNNTPGFKKILAMI